MQAFQKTLGSGVPDLEKIFSGLDELACWISGLTLSGLAFMITYDVLSRFLFNSPLPAGVEVAQLMLPYVVLVPMAATLARGQHVKVTLLTQYLSPLANRILAAVVRLFEAGICLVLTWHGWKQFSSSYAIGETMMAAIPLPWWVGKFAFPLGMGLLTLYLFRLWLDAVFKRGQHA